MKSTDAVIFDLENLQNQIKTFAYVKYGFGKCDAFDLAVNSFEELVAHLHEHYPGSVGGLL